MRQGRARGFTLIELLIAIAVVAILLSVAVAGYGFAAAKARRAAAKGCLTEAAQSLERYYTLHFTYVGAALPSCSADFTTHYTVAFASGEPTATTFRVQAVPQGAQASADASCGTLTLDSTGVQGAGDGSAATVDSCW